MGEMNENVGQWMDEAVNSVGLLSLLWTGYDASHEGISDATQEKVLESIVSACADGIEALQHIRDAVQKPYSLEDAAADARAAAAAMERGELTCED